MVICLVVIILLLSILFIFANSGYIFMLKYLGLFIVIVLKVRYCMIIKYGYNYITCFLLTIGYKRKHKIYSAKKHVLQSTIAYYTMGVFSSIALISHLLSIEASLPLDQLLPEYFQPNVVLPSDSERLERLINVSKELSGNIQLTYREGNHNASSGKANREEIASVLDGPVLKSLRQKHVRIMTEIQNLHKEGNRAPNSLDDKGKLITTKEQLITYRTSSSR